MSSITINLPDWSATPEVAQELGVLLTGSVLPWIIATANQAGWSSRKRLATAVLFSVAAAVVEQLVTTKTLSPANATLDAIKILSTAVVTYNSVWKQLGIEKFEELTTRAILGKPATEDGQADE